MPGGGPRQVIDGINVPGFAERERHDPISHPTAIHPRFAYRWGLEKDSLPEGLAVASGGRRVARLRSVSVCNRGRIDLLKEARSRPEDEVESRSEARPESIPNRTRSALLGEFN
jgi:hypothetical protein